MTTPATPAGLVIQRPFDRTVGIAFMLFVILGLPDGLLGLAWPSIRAEFGLTQDAIGGFLLAGTLGFLLTSFNGGLLLDRLGAGGMTLLAALLRGGAFVAILAAPSWPAVIACNFVAGMGTGMLDAGVNTYLSGYGSTRLLSWLHACFGIGATLGPLLMGRLFDLGLGWQWGYGVGGAAQIAVAMLVLATLAHWRMAPHPDHDDGAFDSNDRNGGSSGNAGSGSRRGLSPLMTLRLLPVWFSIAIFAVYAGIEVGAGQWSYTLFTEGRGVSDGVAEVFVSLYWGSFTVGRILFGGIGERIPTREAMRVSGLGIIAGAALLWLNPAQAGQFVGIMLLGFMLAPVFPTLIAATPRRVGPRHAANTIGFQVGAASLGIAVFPWMAGLLAETTGQASIGVGASQAGFRVFESVHGFSLAATGLEAIGPFLVALAVALFALHEALLVVSARPARVGASGTSQPVF